MKFIFPILAILVCGGATYFSLDHSSKFEAVQEQRLVAISTNKSVTASADKADVDKANEEQLLENSKKELALANSSVDILQADNNQLKNDVAKLDVRIADQDKEFAQLNAAIEEVKAILAGLGQDVTIETLPDIVNEISDDIIAKKSKLEELNTLVEGAEKRLASSRDEVSRLVDRKSSRSERIRRNAMSARVTAVNQDWGFIVIGAGSNSGFTPQTSLLVKRDGKLIGRVTPSSIEKTQTIANIELDSLASGVRIQTGDTVILAKPAGN
ncbi:MAG: hypothetical protein NWT08_13445 [Akkermansiaceae bacterium]|jgi:uncharacterized protein YhaN|nr:hypothetical protein [Akkermansiaceae bacterium]MDP4647644.1 hypothetical protein [Akkermansiaceae bacterium]MDP4722297.1 hypothetical protein [Akkermansiaceae bacterium]MDP4780337.1 hypothetical protein [Akkermansiaceae bacterium]MDP4846179.1 hypothetical protein [Akkermansiaceae bacterium]